MSKASLKQAASDVDNISEQVVQFVDRILNNSRDLLEKNVESEQANNLFGGSEIEKINTQKMSEEEGKTKVADDNAIDTGSEDHTDEKKTDSTDVAEGKNRDSEDLIVEEKQHVEDVIVEEKTDAEDVIVEEKTDAEDVIVEEKSNTEDVTNSPDLTDGKKDSEGMGDEKNDFDSRLHALKSTILKSTFQIPSIHLQESHKVMGVEFAPVSMPLERRLQTLAVLQWWMGTLIFVPMGIILTAYVLFFTRFWFLAVFYLSWVVLYDRKTPKMGGRRSRIVRNLKWWTYFRDYFPISLHKTAELDPSENYIIGYHPHGIISCGAFCNFGTESTGFSKLFPGITCFLLTLNIQFYWPILRGYIMACGLCDVSRESINWVTTKNGKGNAVVIVIGGAEEALEARPNNYRLKLKNRKGFCKIALQTGSHLVPCYSFGENELFKQADNPKGSKIRQFQEGFKNIFGFSPPLVYGRGVFNYSFGLMPFRKPIATVVGKPIIVSKKENPSTEDVDALHKTYIDALSSLFNEHKEKYEIGKEAELEII